jgi:hypothetical protein
MNPTVEIAHEATGCDCFLERLGPALCVCKERFMQQIQRFFITALAGLLFIAPGAFAKGKVKPAGRMKMHQARGPKVYRARKNKAIKPYYKGRH